MGVRTVVEAVIKPQLSMSNSDFSPIEIQGTSSSMTEASKLPTDRSHLCTRNGKQEVCSSSATQHRIRRARLSDPWPAEQRATSRPWEITVLTSVCDFLRYLGLREVPDQTPEVLELFRPEPKSLSTSWECATFFPSTRRLDFRSLFVVCKKRKKKTSIFALNRHLNLIEPCARQLEST